MTKSDSDETKIALINLNVSTIQRDVMEIKESVKGLNTIFASRDQLVQVAKETETRITRLENSSNLWKFISPSLAAIMGSVLTYLIIQYLMSLR